MNTTRLAVATDILVRAATAGERKLTSMVLAHSLNTNAVVVRRIVGQLSRAGLARSVPGPGGVVLCRAAELITLADVLRAVIPEGEGWLLPMHPVSSGQEGRHIRKALRATFQAAEKAILDELARVTIADLVVAG